MARVYFLDGKQRGRTAIVDDTAITAEGGLPLQEA